MPEDPFRNTVDSPIAPAEYCFPVVPDDLLELARVTKAIYVGEGGDLTLLSVRGEEVVTFRNVPSGAILDVRVRAVHATGTTATSLVGLA